MAATRENVDKWIESAKERGAKYIISVCDTFDWSDYPVYCEDKQELEDRYPEFDGNNMQSINEIIRIEDDGQVTENLRGLSNG